jgi:hypothetical protein
MEQSCQIKEATFGHIVYWRYFILCIFKLRKGKTGHGIQISLK